MAGATITFGSGRMHARHRQRAAWRPRPAGAGAAASPSLTHARTPPLTWRRRVPASASRGVWQWHWNGEAIRRAGARARHDATQRTAPARAWSCGARCPSPGVALPAHSACACVAGALRPSLLALLPALTPRTATLIVTAHGRTCHQSV